MKKVAILTQPLGHNYGGMLQAWALQQVLKKLGCDVVTIDRQPARTSFIYLCARLTYRFLMKVLNRRKASIFIESKKKIAYQNTQKFIDLNLSISESIYSTQQLKEHFDKKGYDVVIVGSDQTWRPKYSPCIENFYLDFLETSNIKKIAYASSFGVDKWEYSPNQTKVCLKLVHLFDAVSVREDSGVSLCKKYLNIDAQHVLDPTLLICEEDYKKLIGEQNLNHTDSGIYTYILDRTADKEDFIKKIADKLKESVFSCQSEYTLTDSKNIEDCILPDPKDWLAGFANAKYVITDSFHGMVYSIIFNKPFVVIGNKDRGIARFTSLLQKMNLSERLIIDLKEDYDFKDDINWNNVNLLKQSYINNSVNYLKKII